MLCHSCFRLSSNNNNNVTLYGRVSVSVCVCVCACVCAPRWSHKMQLSQISKGKCRSEEPKPIHTKLVQPVGQKEAQTGEKEWEEEGDGSHGRQFLVNAFKVCVCVINESWLQCVHTRNEEYIASFTIYIVFLLHFIPFRMWQERLYLVCAKVCIQQRRFAYVCRTEYIYVYSWLCL